MWNLSLSLSLSFCFSLFLALFASQIEPLLNIPPNFKIAHRTLESTQNICHRDIVGHWNVLINVNGFLRICIFVSNCLFKRQSKGEWETEIFSPVALPWMSASAGSPGRSPRVRAGLQACRPSPSTLQAESERLRLELVLQYATSRSRVVSWPTCQILVYIFEGQSDRKRETEGFHLFHLLIPSPTAQDCIWVSYVIVRGSSPGALARSWLRAAGHKAALPDGMLVSQLNPLSHHACP